MQIVTEDFSETIHYSWSSTKM